MQTHRCPACDQVFIFLSQYASAVSLVFLLYLAYEVFWRKRRPLTDFLMPALALLFTAAGVRMLKFLIRRPRPYVTFHDIGHPVAGGEYSFPSGHTAEVFTLLFALWMIFPSRGIRFFLTAWALFVAYTRMAFGVHYPTDIAGGIGLAALSVWLASRLIDIKKK